MDRPERLPNLYGLPWQLDPPDRLRYFQRQGVGFRRRRSPEFLLSFRVPAVGAYEHQVLRIINYAWTLLPQEWKGSSKLQLRFSYHRGNPKLEYSEEAGNEVIRYSTNVGSQANPEFIFAESEIANRTYDFHESTQKYSQGFQFRWRRNDLQIQKIRSWQDLDRAAQAHIADRVEIKEHYEAAYLDHLRSEQPNASNARDGYLRPDYLHLSFLRMRFDDDEES